MSEFLPAVEVEGSGLGGGHSLPARALDVGSAVLLMAGCLPLSWQTDRALLVTDRALLVTDRALLITDRATNILLTGQQQGNTHITDY